jgi:hypothetical protein
MDMNADTRGQGIKTHQRNLLQKFAQDCAPQYHDVQSPSGLRLRGAMPSVGVEEVVPSRQPLGVVEISYCMHKR